MKRASLAITAALLIGLLLSACGRTPTEAPAEGPTKLVLTDALGRTITFDAPPQRLLVAGKRNMTVAETLYLFPEARERVIGLVVGKQPIGEFIALVDPNWDQKEHLAPDAGPEQIAPLKPDVVLLRSFTAETLGRALEELQIPVMYFDLETPEQYFHAVDAMGQLLGNPARAEEIRNYYQSRLDRIEEAVSGLDGGQKPGVLLLEYTDEGGEVALSVPPAEWLQTTEVEMAGGAPVWIEAAQSGGWTVVNFEQIAAWDPDQIYIVAYQTDAAEVVAGLKANPQWQALQAVQNDAIYGFPADIFSWDQPEPRWILGVTWLAGQIHPELFPDLDMRQEAAEFFGQLYGMEPAAVEASIVPILKGSLE
ncbi:MAG: ABC transporter substrate-binding protein [Anaerolineae bacterium]